VPAGTATRVDGFLFALEENTVGPAHPLPGAAVQTTVDSQPPIASESDTLVPDHREQFRIANLGMTNHL
jgi:hypothetical protein